MLSFGQDALILIATLAAALLFMALLNRLWSGEKRSVNNDLIGWQLTIIGTTYAVILGFMLYTVWTAYGEAQANVDLEANSLRDLYRTADALPEPQRTQLKLDARAYAEAVIDHDWPEMADGKVPEGSHLINEAMWKTVMTLKPDSQTAVVYTNEVLNQLTTLTEHRRTRMLQIGLQTSPHLLGRPHHRRDCHGTLGGNLRRTQHRAARLSGHIFHAARHPGSTRDK